tara:strand:+ start:35 stop:658 length:624 start_codon:yes stop_codon:yes gene_type:complete
MTKPILGLKKRKKLSPRMPTSHHLTSSFNLTKLREHQPKVGISACLSSENVRYDGCSKGHHLIQQELLPWLDLHSICPEVEARLGVPRPPIQLVQTSRGIHALGVEDSTFNVTKALTKTSEQLVKERCKDLCAYIVKARSPSCGYGSTPIYDTTGGLLGTGNGRFVEILKTALPHLIIVEESCFSCIQECKTFIERCYLLHKKTLRG